MLSRPYDLYSSSTDTERMSDQSHGVCQVFTIRVDRMAQRISTQVCTMFRFAATALLLAATLAAPMPALAQDGAPISVNVNMARILRISAPAATVIVGNPGIADVTIQDPQTLILTGKSYGQTNLIVLDSRGEPVADTLVEVVQMSAGIMTVYQGQSRTTLSCAPTCQPVVMMGDDTGYSGQVLASSQLVQSAAN
ncbi:pilus assembly protein CpaC [Devosia sp. L53-10-65]|uniref:Pilus assembly protein CpaC n=2 Tax=Devosia marina TaxID=2683198 RepID=A0A7X3K5A8_9HYPH|nr:pilus assembly protein CpaC [Devosia marina]